MYSLVYHISFCAGNDAHRYVSVGLCDWEVRACLAASFLERSHLESVRVDCNYLQDSASAHGDVCVSVCV